MNPYIITLLCLTSLGLGVALAKDGEPRRPFSFWTSLVAAAIEWTLLYKAGVLGL